MNKKQLEELLEKGDLTQEQDNACKMQINKFLGYEKHKVAPPKKYALNELPVEVFIDLEQKDSTNSAASFFLSATGGLLLLGGLVLMAVGGWYLATGPSMIIYDRIEGMTFEQKLQSYPGPIASVGGLLAMLGSLCFKAQNNDQMGIPNDKLNEHLSFKIEELADNQELQVSARPDGMFELDVKEVNPPESPS